MVIIILYSLFILFLLSYIDKRLKEADDLFEKCSYYLLIIICSIPLFVYYFDRFNIISKLGILKGINSDRWFSFISSYLSGIISTVLSGFILIWITFRQIKTQIKDSKDTKRIQNAPLIKYDFSDKKIDFELEYYMYNPCYGDKVNPYSVYLELANIGLNHAKSFKFNVLIGDDFDREFDLDYQSIIQKDNSIVLNLIFFFIYDKKGNNDVLINFIFKYKDVLNNSYEQNVKLFGTITNTSGSQYGGYRFAINNIEVEDEHLT